MEETPEKTSAPSRGPRWGRILISIFVSFLVLSALAVVVGNRGLEQKQPASDPTIKHEDAADKAAQEDAEAFLSRATGQQYLLGVGKADITG